MRVRLFANLLQMTGNLKLPLLETSPAGNWKLLLLETSPFGNYSHWKQFSIGGHHGIPDSAAGRCSRHLICRIESHTDRAAGIRSDHRTTGEIRSCRDKWAERHHTIHRPPAWSLMVEHASRHLGDRSPRAVHRSATTAGHHTRQRNDHGRFRHLLADNRSDKGSL